MREPGADHAADGAGARPPTSPGDPPAWSAALRALREARAVTQEGWAARLGVGRRTVQRWERGEVTPEPHAEDAILAYCRDSGLYRTFDHGPLRGVTVSDGWLRDLLADARLGLGGADARPALRPVEAPAGRKRATGLPVPLTPLIDREVEAANLTHLLAASRLVTLTGPGGVGKTRLAIAVAAQAAASLDDGVWFVPLAPVRDVGLVAAAIAQALGVRERPDLRLIDGLKAHLSERTALLVLDNLEHLTDAAPLIVDLLEATTSVTVLATSRIALRVRGERDFPLAPLALPRPEPDLPLAALAAVPSVQLFTERAAAARPDFALGGENAAAVAQLCRRLDGLPLAIELAAARSRALTPQAMLPHLDRRLGFLTGGPRDLPERQQTLRATMAWSHDLLTVAPQAMFRRLAVFAGGCTLAAATAVCATAAGRTVVVLDEIETLLGHSLLIRDTGPDGEPRFRMLETVQEFAAELLVMSGELDEVSSLHADHFLAFAATAAAAARGPDRGAWLERLRAERSNLEAALSWIAATGDAARGLRLITALAWWYRTEASSDGRRWGEALLASPGAAGRTPERAAALVAVGEIVRATGDLGAARRVLDEGVALWRSFDDRAALGRALIQLSGALAMEPEACHAAVVEGVALLREAGAPWDLAYALMMLGQTLVARNDDAAARRALDECIALHDSHGDPYLLTQALITLARAEAQDGAFDAAAARLEQAVTFARGSHESYMLMAALQDLATVYLLKGDLAGSVALCAEGIALSRREGFDIGVAVNLDGLAAALLQAGAAEPAARLFAAAAALRDRLRYPLVAFQSRYEQYIAAMRATLGDEGFERAWMAGQSLSTATALQEAAGVLANLGLAVPSLDT